MDAAGCTGYTFSFCGLDRLVAAPSAPVLPCCKLKALLEDRVECSQCRVRIGEAHVDQGSGKAVDNQGRMVRVRGVVNTTERLVLEEVSKVCLGETEVAAHVLVIELL